MVLVKQAESWKRRQVPGGALRGLASAGQGDPGGGAGQIGKEQAAGGKEGEQQGGDPQHQHQQRQKFPAVLPEGLTEQVGQQKKHRHHHLVIAEKVASTLKIKKL